jgi:hypothetical protein
MSESSRELATPYSARLITIAPSVIIVEGKRIIVEIIPIIERGEG